MLRRRFSSATPFTPTSIPSLRAWWDAQDAATLFSDDAGTVPAADGDKVAFWREKVSGVANMLQPDNFKRYLLNATIINNHPGLITGANGLMVSAADVVLDQPKAEVWIVTWVPYTANGSILDTGDGTNPPGSIHVYTLADFYTYSGAVGNVGPTTIRKITDLGPQIIRSTIDFSLPTNEINMSVNGVAATERTDNNDNGATMNAFPVSLGGNFGLGPYYGGAQGDVYLFNGALTAPQAASMASYLAAKWL
jgi:hypothetical protein